MVIYLTFAKFSKNCNESSNSNPVIIYDWFVQPKGHDISGYRWKSRRFVEELKVWWCGFAAKSTHWTAEIGRK